VFRVRPTAGGHSRRSLLGSQIGPTRHMRDLNELPRTTTRSSTSSAYFEAKGRRQLDYISSQGCRFRCTFCADPYVFGRAWSGIDPKRMGDELEKLWRRHQFDDLNFQDETYFTHRQRVTAVCEEILRRDLRFTWAATMRADQGVRLEESEWALCKRSGLRRVMVGVESGSQAMMDWLQKDIKLEQVFETAEHMVRHGIAGIFPFIVGFPDETDESVEATLSVIKRLRRMSRDFEVSVYFYQPYPGSPIAEMIWQRGYRKPQSLSDWADFDYVGSRGVWVSEDKWRRVQRFKVLSAPRLRAQSAPGGTPVALAGNRLACERVSSTRQLKSWWSRPFAPGSGSRNVPRAQRPGRVLCQGRRGFVVILVSVMKPVLTGVRVAGRRKVTGRAIAALEWIALGILIVLFVWKGLAPGWRQLNTDFPQLLPGSAALSGRLSARARLRLGLVSATEGPRRN